MRWLAVLPLVACDALTTETCEGRAWDGGGPLIDAGASIEPSASAWIAGLDDASLDVAEVDFTEASCSDGAWWVTTDADEGEADEVRAGVWNLETRSFGVVAPLEPSMTGWEGEVVASCAGARATTVVAMPVADGVFGRPEGSQSGAINGYTTVNGTGAATMVTLTTEPVDAVEMLVIDLMRGTAAGPTPLVRDGSDTFGNWKWNVAEADRVCREDGDFLLFGFFATVRDEVVGAWAL